MADNCSISLGMGLRKLRQGIFCFQFDDLKRFEPEADSVATAKWIEDRHLD